MKGWECPKCGFCYAPFIEACGNCNRISTTLSSGTIPIPRCPPHDFSVTETTGGRSCLKCGALEGLVTP